MNGVFAVWKPSGPTSQDVVSKLKYILSRSPRASIEQPKGQKRGRRNKFIKIGHGGTLDPLATGVLVIGVGSGTKQLQQYLGQCSKVYSATALLGASTTTFDSEGSVLEYGAIDPAAITENQIEGAVSKFKGNIKQLPPVFSAVKMDGKPLYEYARENIPLPRAIDPRECEVSYLDAKLESKELSLPENIADDQAKLFTESVLQYPAVERTAATAGRNLELKFSVSSGTYIRTLVHDIGRELGTNAHITRLSRESQGEWELEKNVLPLYLFEREEAEWWPVLETVLNEGPQRQIDLAEKEEIKEDYSKE